MKRWAGVLAQGIALGLGLGLCQAGLVGILYRALQGEPGDSHFSFGMLYFLGVGGLGGFFGGWCLGLQWILGNFLTALFLKVAQRMPMEVQQAGEAWIRKVGDFLRETLQPLPGFLYRIFDRFFILRLEDGGRLQRAWRRARSLGTSEKAGIPEIIREMLQVFLEPLFLFFYTVYVILLLVCCVFWSIPFLTL